MNRKVWLSVSQESPGKGSRRSNIDKFTRNSATVWWKKVSVSLSCLCCLCCLSSVLASSAAPPRSAVCGCSVPHPDTLTWSRESKACQKDVAFLMLWVVALGQAWKT